MRSRCSNGRGTIRRPRQRHPGLPGRRPRPRRDNGEGQRTEHLRKHGRTVTKSVVVASGTVSLKAGERATLKLRLNCTGKALLRGHRSLKGLATLTQAGRKVASAKVTLKG